jgi:hypothetical protein
VLAEALALIESNSIQQHKIMATVHLCIILFIPAVCSPDPMFSFRFHNDNENKRKE